MKKNQIEDLQDAGLLNLPVEKIEGRVFYSNGKRYIDFISTNYLGLDRHPKLTEFGVAMDKEWGSLVGWSRLEADPIIYKNLEARVAKFLGVEDLIFSHTITITNFSIMPYLAQQGVIFTDKNAHKVVYESARLARDHGAKIVGFNHQSMEDLEDKLKEYQDEKIKVIAVDGVYSISGQFCPVKELQDLAEKYNAWLFIDDAHGFGVVGRNQGDITLNDGSGVVNHLGGDYERTFYTTSFGKAFCTHGAFLAVPKQFKGYARENCLQYIFSAPINPFNVGQIQACLDLNETQGEQARKVLFENTQYFVRELKELGLDILNNDGFPIVYWRIGDINKLTEVAKSLYAHGVTAGLRPYPLVPVDQCGMRFGITALHTRELLDETISKISQVWR